MDLHCLPFQQNPICTGTLTIVRLLDEVIERALGNFEVSDDPILHGFNGDDISRSAAKHFLPSVLNRCWVQQATRRPSHRDYPA